MDMSHFPPFLIFVPSEDLNDDDCSQLTAPFEDDETLQMDEEENFSRIMVMMENDLDRRVKRADEDIRKLWQEQERLDKPARRRSARTAKTWLTSDSATGNIARASINGSRRRLPSAKKQFKRIGSFLYDPTSKRMSFPLGKEMKSKDVRGTSVDKKVTANNKSRGLLVDTIERRRYCPAAA